MKSTASKYSTMLSYSSSPMLSSSAVPGEGSTEWGLVGSQRHVTLRCLLSPSLRNPHSHTMAGHVWHKRAAARLWHNGAVVHLRFAGELVEFPFRPLSEGLARAPYCAIICSFLSLSLSLPLSLPPPPLSPPPPQPLSLSLLLPLDHG